MHWPICRGSSCLSIYVAPPVTVDSIKSLLGTRWTSWQVVSLGSNPSATEKKAGFMSLGPLRHRRYLGFVRDSLKFVVLDTFAVVRSPWCSFAILCGFGGNSGPFISLSRFFAVLCDTSAVFRGPSRSFANLSRSFAVLHGSFTVRRRPSRSFRGCSRSLRCPSWSLTTHSRCFAGILGPFVVLRGPSPSFAILCRHLRPFGGP